MQHFTHSDWVMASSFLLAGKECGPTKMDRHCRGGLTLCQGVHDTGEGLESLGSKSGRGTKNSLLEVGGSKVERTRSRVPGEGFQCLLDQLNTEGMSWGALQGWDCGARGLRVFSHFLHDFWRGGGKASGRESLDSCSKLSLFHCPSGTPGIGPPKLVRRCFLSSLPQVPGATDLILNYLSPQI